jgi:hypothetical protein
MSESQCSNNIQYSIQISCVPINEQAIVTQDIKVF